MNTAGPACRRLAGALDQPDLEQRPRFPASASKVGSQPIFPDGGSVVTDAQQKLPDAELPARLRKIRLRRAEASEYLELAHGIAITVATLTKMASRRTGPRYSKLNRSPLYVRADIDAWVAATLKPAF